MTTYVSPLFFQEKEEDTTHVFQNNLQGIHFVIERGRENKAERKGERDRKNVHVGVGGEDEHK